MMGGLTAQAAPAAAQAPGWNATLVVQPYPSPFLADWERNPQMAILNLLYTGTAPQDFRVEGFVRSAERGELARVASPPITFAFGPVTQLFTSADILDWETVSRDQVYTDQVLRTGMIPEGRHQMCARVLDAQNVELAQTCADFTIALPEPPQLIFPGNKGVVAGLLPVFQWTPIFLPPEIGAMYRLRVFELLEEQTPETATLANPVWFEAEATAPLVIYPLDALPLDPMKEYVWQVEALDGEGRPVTRGGRSSEIWTFSVGGPGRDLGETKELPDTLTLIPGVARLTGIRSAQVGKDEFAYVVNGWVNLELDAPLAGVVRVEALDLAIDQASILTLPMVRSGELRGSIKAGGGLDDAAGPLVRFTEIGYGAATGLTLAADLALPGADAMTLSGRVQVTASGLFGTLRAERAGGRPLLALGNDPVQLTVRRAQLTLPGGTLALDGDLQLFARDIGCDGVQMAVTPEGALTATAACSPNKVLPLVGDAARAQIALRSIGGMVTIGLDDGALTYALSASGDFRLDAGLGGGVGANCGAGIALALTDGDVSVPSFTPRCDAGEGESDMGWLKTRLSSLTLNRFAYTPGQGFDFELVVDLAPWLPAIEGLELPRLTQVTVTQSGFSIPAVDVTVARPPFTLGGFGLKVTRVQLPAFTLTWNDWQIGSANKFRFAVDAELTLPEFPGDGGACLNARPIRITGAEIANGKFRAKLEEQRFTPACGITLFAPDAGGTGGATGDSGAVATGGAGSGMTCGSGPGIAGMMGADNCIATQTVLESLPQDWQERSGCSSVQELVDASIAWSQVPGNVFQTYTTVKCPGPSLPEDWANPYTEQETWTAPPLVETQGWPADPEAAERVYRQEVNTLAAERAKLDAAISREGWPCGDECKKRLATAQEAFDEAEAAVEARMNERDFGDVQRQTRECLGIERQKALLGATEDSEGDLCEGIGLDNDSVIDARLKRVRDRVGKPPDCAFAVPYAARAALGIERQGALLGTGGGDADALASTAEGMADCAKPKLDALIEACRDPNAGPLLILDRLSQVVRFERERQLLGAVDDGNAGDAGSTSAGAAQGTTGSEATTDAAWGESTAAVQECLVRMNGQYPGMIPQLGRRGPEADAPAVLSRWPAGDFRTGEPGRASGPYVDDPWTDWLVTEPGERESGTPVLADLPGRAPATTDPPSGGVRLEIERFGGELVIGFSPYFMIERVPEIDGNVVLPPLFTCADSTLERQPVLTKLRLGPRGEINGTITGFVPTCPLDLAAVRVQVTDASLTFSTASGNQSAVLSASATATFTLTTTPVTGRGSLAVDLLRGRILTGSLAFQGPFRLDLPRDKPVFSFQVQTASLDSAGVHIDGRAELTLANAPAIGVTFDRVTIDPRRVALTRGQVLFDVPFAFEVGIGSDGALAWRATQRGAALGVATGLRVDLPSRIALGPQGFSASGDGGARLVFEGRDVDSLAARFSGDFALGTNPPRVASGMVDFQRAGVSLAYIDALGFHPNLAYFATAVLPARLPLPVESVAYLELRDANNDLRVSSENVGSGIRLYTASGVTIPLVLPALQLGRATPPRVNVSFDVTLDPLGQGIRTGAITVALSPGDRAAFDLSALGLPLVIDTLAYDREPDGAYRMAVGGALALFGQAPTAPPPTKVLLTLDGNGTLAGSVDMPLQQSVALVQGSNKLTLALASASGVFNANLPTGRLQYRLDVTGDLALETAPGEWYRASATLEVSDLGVKTTNLRYATGAEGQDSTRFIDLEAFRLGLRNLRVPLLAWDQVNGFRFELLFDAVLNFPTLSNLTLPPIRDISLRNDGFTIPAYEIPELALDTAAFGAADLKVSFIEDTLRFGGFVLQPLAFRMGEISYSWFTGQGPANWGFGFDVEFRFANLGSDVPVGLRNVSLRLLNAGLQNGQLYGSLERVAFPQPLDLGIGDLYAVWGQIPARLEPPSLGPSAADTAAVLRVEANLDLAAALPVCNATIQSNADTLALYADGWVAGRITGVVPACEGSLGPFQFAFGSSELVLGGDWVNGARQRRVELAVDGRVTLPGVSGGSVTAQGSVRFDVLNGRMIDGRIAIDRPFRWTPPDGNPYLAFDVNSAVLDTAGLRFTGGGQLRLADGATVGVTFNDFVLGLPDFAPKSGSATITSQLALGVGISPQGQLTWGAYSLAAPRPAGSSFRLVLPQTVTIDATGLALTGTASASLAFADQEFATLDVNFLDGFAIGVTPLGVGAGRADFVLNGETVAYLDPRGFWPGNVFAAFTLPDRVGLPGQDVAYVQLRDDTGALVVQSSSSADGIRIQTRPNTPARLVVPALAASGQQAPAADVEFDLVVNSTTFQPVSGFVRATAPANGPSLFSLRDRGVPLEVRSVSFEAAGAGAGLRLAARVQLPASLAAADLVIPDLVVTAQGLTGTAEVGAYAETYDAQRQPVRTVALGPDVSLEITGARVTFGTGSGADVRLAGALKSPVFAPQGGAPAPLFFTGRVSTGEGFALTVDPGKQPSAVLPLAVATFEPQSLGGQPAFQITASETEFRVRLSGTLRVPSLSPTLALTLDGLEVGTAGVRVPTMSFGASDGPPRFGLFGATFALRDSSVGGNVVYPALAGSYAQGNVTVTLSGDVEVFNAAARFAGLTISTAGDVSLAAASVTNGPLEVVPNVLTLEQLALAFSGGAERRFEVAAAGRITLPAPGGDTVAAQGNLRADLASGRILDGRIDVTQPFRWQAPGGSEFLTFTVSQAHLDAAGLHFTGGGQLRLADGAAVGVAFNDLVVGLPGFVPTAGSATFTSPFALGVGIGGDGQLAWGAYALDAPRPAGNSFRATLPSTVTLDATGLRLGGAASASLRFADQDFATLDVSFVDGFAIGFAPVKVTAGRATFAVNGEQVAYVDAGGFWPGNLFAALPVPRRLGLPGEDVAYLEVRDAQDALLIETATTATGLQLRTRTGGTVRLVIPALAVSGGQPPAADVALDVVVNPTTFQLVSGAIQVSAPSGQSLFDLRDRGLPLDVRTLAYERVGDAYGLRLDARLQLPASIAAADLVLQNLLVTSTGLTGTAELGTYADTYDPQVPPVRSVALAQSLTLDVTGVRATFGDAPSVRLAGALESPLFAPSTGAPAPLPYTAQLTTDGFTLTVDPNQLAAPTLPIAVATFQPQSLGGQPAFQVTASASEFRLRLSGTIRLPTLSPGLAVTVSGLEVGTAGVRIPAVSITEPQEFALFGASLRLRDSTSGGNVIEPAVSGSYSQNGLALTLNGELTVFGNTSRFSGLTISANGDVQLAGATLLSRPVALIPDLLTADQLGLAISGTGDARRIDLSARARVALPAPSGDSVVAQGSVRLDLASGRLLDGGVELTRTFRWQLAGDNPYLRFDVDRARLDSAGLRFTGGGKLRLADGATASVTFNDLLFRLPDFALKAGSATITSQFAVGVGMGEDGGFAWGAYALNAPRPAGSSFRVALPSNITIDTAGVRLAGTATAALRFGDRDFPTLQVLFADSFAIGFTPLKVASGRADFVLNADTVARVDAGGFWPGNIFAVIPVPQRLGLPTESVAYLELKDSTGAVLVQTSSETAGLRLRTRPNAPVRLVVPALAAEGVAPSAAISFDVVVNPTTWQLVSGFVRAEAASGNDALFSLAGLGIPLTVRRIAYEPVGQTYGLRLAGRLLLPQSLDSLAVDVPDLTVSAAGLSGEVRLGSYVEGAGRPTQPLARHGFMNDSLVVRLDGARLVFGAAPSFQLAGSVSTFLFKRENEPAALINWSGDVSPAGVTLQLDPLSSGVKLPLAVASFEPKAIGSEPAFRITATAQDFSVRLSGVLTMPSLSPTFAVSLGGLEFGTRGVSLASSAVSGLDQQALELFGARFTLRDSTASGTVVFPAVAMSVEQGVLAVSLAGQVEFMGNTSRFAGLRIRTDGQVSLASANLLSQPLTIVQDVLALDQLSITNNRLRADLSITLPEPLDGAGPQQGFFEVGADGQIAGGASLALVQEAAGLNPQSRMQFDLGVATVHLRYLGLDLDFAALQQNSAVKVVTDVYIQNSADNRIQLGDVVGNVVQPGLRVGFDGSVTWGNLALAREFDFDFEAVRLRLTNVSLPAQASGFAIGFSGQLSLGLEAVSGSLAFRDFVITSQGDVQFNPSGVDGGELAIAQVVTLSVAGFEYSSTPTSIEIRSGGMPSGGQAATSGTQTVDVASYIRFGGSISVAEVFSGGVQEFLLYRTPDQLSHLIVREASLAIQDVITMRADFRYDQNATGFEMLMGAQGQLFGTYGVALVGAVAQEQQLTRVGIFLAAQGLTIPVPGVPIITITGLGGGFFLNPKAEYLDLVRQYANVSQTAGRKIAAPAGDFAVMLYGAASIVRPELIEGRILLTIMNTAIQIDGAMEVLGQGGRFSGDAHLVIGLQRAYAEGNINLQVKYDGVIEGLGTLDFFVYGADNWGVYGTTDVKIVAFLQGGATLFVGPPGFVVQARIQGGYNIWVVAIEGFFDGTVWYKSAGNEWGAFVKVGVEASVLGGVASARGTLMGALILAQTPLIFAAAELQVQVVGIPWTGIVWVKWENGQPSAGLGSDPAMEAAIAYASSIADEMMAAKDAAQSAVEETRAVVPAAVALTDAELARAYATIQGWSPAAWGYAWFIIAGNEYVAAPQPGEGVYQSWYNDLLKRTGMPGDSALVAQYTDIVDNAFSAIEAERPAVQSRIAALQLGLQPLATSAAPVIPGSPLRDTSFAAPVTTERVNADGRTEKVVVSGPRFDVDLGAAQTARLALGQVQAQADALDQQVRDRIAALEAGLATVRAATTASGSGSLAGFAKYYADVGAAAERQFAAQADLLLQRQDWARLRLGDLGARDTTVTRWVQSKTNALRITGSSQAFNALRTLTSQRVKALATFSGSAQIQAQFAIDSTNVMASPDMNLRWNYFTQQANTAGRQLWYDLARVGMEAMSAAVDQEFPQLGTAADTRLAAIRTAHTELSRSLAGMYEAQAAAAGALYDLYDRYLFWRTGESGAPTATTTLSPRISRSATTAPPTAPDLLDVAMLRTRKAALAQDLTVPRLNGVSVTATSTSRYAAHLQFAWSAWHPTGTYEFQFRDVSGGDQPLGAGFLSNGPSGALNSYRFTADRSAANSQTRTFQAGVRGGAGFMGYGRANYTVSFLAGPTAPVSVSGTGLLTDATPPSSPVVTFPGRGPRMNASFQAEVWSSDPNEIAVEWSATDPESGVSDYQYALWSSPSGAEIRPFTTVGGRTGVTLDRLGLASGQVVYVAVRATNGQGLTGGTGVSAAIRYDPTPPAFPTGAAIQTGGNTVPMRTGGGLTLLGASSIPTFPACPIPAVRSRGTGSNTTTVVAPAAWFTLPYAADNESGVVGYQWRVSAQPESVYTASGWTAVPAHPGLALSGAPLDFQEQFYLSVVALNFAGAPSRPVTTGPFRVSDPTAPAAPTYCAAVAGTNDRLNVLVSAWSGDPETGVTGYRYRVRTAAGAVVRDWPATGVDWQPPASFSVADDLRATAPLTLTGGQRYYVDVRAVNGQGLLSEVVSSGPVLYDLTAPPTPSATVSYTLGRFGSMPQLTFQVSAPNDPESGLAILQYAVGAAQGATDVIGWSALPGFTVGSFTTSVAAPPLARGTTFSVQLRTRNGVGTWSAVYPLSVRVP